MIRRHGEWSERLSALVLLTACFCFGFVFRGRVERAHAALDRREHQLDELAAWSHRAAQGAPGVAPDLAGLFDGGFEVVAESSPGARWLKVRAPEALR